MKYWKTYSPIICLSTFLTTMLGNVYANGEESSILSSKFSNLLTEKPEITTLAKSFKVEYGGDGFDEAKSIIKLNAGGYLVAGRTQTASGDTNMHLLKIDDNGALIWEQKIGEEETDEATSVIETPDGNYVVVGTTDSYGVTPDIKDIWVVKINPSGQVIWNKTFGGVQSIDEAKSVVPALDGGVVVVGDTYEFAADGTAMPSNIMIIKIDDKGNEVWKKVIGGAAINEQSTGIVQTKDGYAIVGNIETTGKKWDIWLVNIDKEGNKKWESNYGGGDNEGANDILITKDGGFLMVGYTYTFAVGSHDYWVVKTDANGKEQWNKVFGGVSTDEAFAVLEAKDGNYVVCGYTEVWQSDKNGENISTEGHNIFLVKFSPKGDKIWEKNMGGEADQRAFDMVEADDKGLVMAGFTNANLKSGTNVLIIKVDEAGGSAQ
ncbi:MAG: hypothetical protein OHK0036_19900 [Bacteroidia bacterium]